MQHQGRIITLDTNLALISAKVSLKYKLPLADSVILATAHTHDAVIWTQDADFKNIKGVHYTEKKP